MHLLSSHVKIQTHICFVICAGFSPDSDQNTLSLRKSYYRLWTLLYLNYNHLNAGFVSSPDVNWWTGVLCCPYQTLILTAPIHFHCWDIPPNLMKKQTHPDLGWTSELSFIRVKHVTRSRVNMTEYSFWVNNILLKKHLNLDSSMISRISQWKSHVWLNAVYFIITRSRKTGLADECKRSETRAHIT